jgi:anti-anti-sigma regulatory factor
MVFSFFKKSAEKSEERMPPLRGAPIVSAVVSRPPPAQTPASAPVADDGLDTTINTCYGIEVFEETDPYMEIAEHAAILFANGQYDVARSTLESVIQNNGDQGAVKLWLMLFDLLRVRNDRNAFDALSLDFASICELSPPSWQEDAKPAPGNKAQKVAGVAVLQGAVTSEDDVFDDLRQALSKGEPRTLDMSRLAGIDSAASGLLAKMLHQARRRDLAWGLGGGTEILARRFSARLIAGQTRDENMWLLVLELLQFLGLEAQFEEKAVDYAVTFEVSPPAWEPPRAKPAVKKEEEETTFGGLVLDAPMTSTLEGEILQGKLDSIACQLAPGSECRLDFSRIQRLDFVSAGALATLLKEANCKQITIMHPNRMVAELLRVMGIDKIAHIELARH